MEMNMNNDQVIKMVFDSEFEQVSYELEIMIQNSKEIQFTGYLQSTLEDLKKNPLSAIKLRDKIIANYRVYAQRMKGLGIPVEENYSRAIYGTDHEPRIKSPYSNDIQLDNTDDPGKKIIFDKPEKTIAVNLDINDEASVADIPASILPSGDDQWNVAYDNASLNYKSPNMPLDSQSLNTNEKETTTGKSIVKSVGFIIGLCVLYAVLYLIAVAIVLIVGPVNDYSVRAVLNIIYLIIFGFGLFFGTYGLTFLLENKKSVIVAFVSAFIIVAVYFTINTEMGFLGTVITIFGTFSPIYLRKARI